MKAAEAIKEPVAAAVPDILTGLGPKTGKDKTATLSWNPNL
jgi:hypothetical protein